MRKHILLAGCYFLIAISIFSCKKEKGTGTESFLGKWKTSYGDTILFARVNGKNMITYDRSMNPSMPLTSDYEYAYQNNKLGIKDGIASIPGGFRFFQSFKWLDRGRSFEIQGVEWFLFLSSSGTYFTFTKIP
jgi:hypothetical protein